MYATNDNNNNNNDVEVAAKHHILFRLQGNEKALGRLVGLYAEHRVPAGAAEEEVLELH